MRMSLHRHGGMGGYSELEPNAQFSRGSGSPA